MFLTASESETLSQQAGDLGCDCPACGSDRHQVLGHKGNHKLSKCLHCRSIFLVIAEESGVSKELYDHYYDQARFDIPSATAASYERLGISFAPFRSVGRWLDIGYGEGGLLKSVESQGWRCYGTELSPRALKYGERCGWTVSAHAKADPRFPQHGFDVVTMIEVLEHVSDPDKLLQDATHWLRPGGLLYLTTPNAESLNSRWLGLEWSIFSPPEHITIWTAQGVSDALTRVGFQLRQVRTEGFNPCEILARFRSEGRAAEPVDRNQTAFALNNALSSSPWRRSLKIAANRCLSVFRLGDSLKVQAVLNHKVHLEQSRTRNAAQ